ncbi:MAG: hypothetical protein AAGD96_06175 [Chloroflexota bacterium]
MVQFNTFTLNRLSDDLVYTFDRQQHPNGETGYKRRDGDYWFLFRPEFGWVAMDPDVGEIQGRPWHILPQDQSSDHPPEGEWVSKKGAKSYVYKLLYL